MILHDHIQGVLTLNLSPKKPNSYLSHDVIVTFYWILSCLISPGLTLSAQAIWQAARFGTGDFGVDLNLGTFQS